MEERNSHERVQMMEPNLILTSKQDRFPMRTKANLTHSLTFAAIRRLAMRLAAFVLLFPAGKTWCQIAVRVPDEVLDVRDISVANGSVWLATTKGAYKVEGNSANPFSDERMVVNTVASDGNSVWLATASGAYRIEGQKALRSPDQFLDIPSLTVADDSKVWLATYDGAIVFDGQNMKRLGPPRSGAHDITAVGDAIWVATDVGAYKITSNGSIRLITPSPVFVNSIKAIQGSVWIATRKGAFQVTGEKPPEVFRPNDDVTRVCDLNGEIWLASTTGAYRVSGKQADPVPNVTMAVEDIVTLDGTTWLATNRGAFRMKEGKVSSTPELNQATKSIQKLNDEIWFSTYHGAFLLKDDRFLRVPNVDSEVQKIKLLNNVVWMATNKGAFKVSNVGIRIKTASLDSWWKWIVEKISPWPVYVEGDVSVTGNYVSADGAAVSSPNSADPRFQAVLKSLNSGEPCTISEDEYSGVSGDKDYAYIARIHTGRANLCVGVRDRWGNTAQEAMQVWVLPGPVTVGIVTPLLWFCLLAILIALAPYSEFTNDLLMNPWLRNVSSFGLIPLAMTTFPAIRFHILKRYLKTLGDDRTFKEIIKKYQIPAEKFDPSHFGDRLSSERALQLTGQSGIGKTSFLTFLTAAYAAQGRRGKGIPVHPRPILPFPVIPVFIPLGRYQGQKVEDMVAAQLDSYGRLTDKQMASWYVKQGGFVCLFDGLNEVDDSTRNDVNRFIDEGRQRSYFCVTSQEAYPRFSWIREVRLAYLTDQNVKDIIESRLTPKKVAETLAQFSRETFNQYKLPQDLEFLLQMLTDGNSAMVPQTKSKLYDSVLSPIFATWKDEGRSDFPDLLTARAYEMLVTRDPRFNSPAMQPAEELTGPLVVRKLLLQRDSGLYFQHNLIRDYLGSAYLKTRWRELLPDIKVPIDSNWLEILRFVLAGLIDPKVCKEFLYAVFERNRTVAGELFTWIDSAQIGLTADWSAEFRLKIADAVLDTRQVDSRPQ